jgi:thymidylate kinase
MREELGILREDPVFERTLDTTMRLLRALSPRPQCAYLLQVPAEAAAQRSAAPEDAALLAEQAALRSKIAAAWGVQIVDNSAPFDEVSAGITRETLRRYYRDFRTLRNMIFFSNPKRR